MRTLGNSQIWFRFCLTAFLSTVSVFVVSAQQTNEVQKLLLNQTLERSIKGGEMQVFQFNVKAGFYARAEVEQKNIDVVVSLFAPEDKLVVEMDGKDGYLWRESVSAIAENSDTIFRVKIRAYETAKNNGSYIIKLAESRSIETKDRQRIEAEQHFPKGRKLYLQKKPDYVASIKEYESAIKILQELGEKQLQ